MQKTGAWVFHKADAPLPASDLERSAGKELPLWLPVHLGYDLSASGAFGRAVFVLLQ
jgi:hypothetical protein